MENANKVKNNYYGRAKRRAIREQRDIENGIVMKENEINKKADVKRKTVDGENEQKE